MSLYFAQLWAVAWKDLLVEFRSRERVGAMAGFTVLVGVLFNYAIDPTLVRPEDIASGLVWMTVVFAGTLGLGRTFELEAMDGAFQGVLMTPVPRDALFLGKVLSNYVILMVVVLLVLGVFGLFFALDWGSNPGALVGPSPWALSDSSRSPRCSAPSRPGPPWEGPCFPSSFSPSLCRWLSTAPARRGGCSPTVPFPRWRDSSASWEHSRWVP